MDFEKYKQVYWRVVGVQSFSFVRGLKKLKLCTPDTRQNKIDSVL
jgi:hypothetical protein